MVNNDTSSITPYTAVLISKAAYANIPPATVENWRLIDKADINDYGYAGVAYSHPKVKIILIAHRGTEAKILSNLVTDATLFFDRKPLAQQLAQAFSLRVRNAADNYQIIETGHSLGGFHAELNAAHFGSQCITFDSPGSGDYLQTQALESNNFTTYLSLPNSINTAKSHIGKVYRVLVPHTEARTLTALNEAVQPLLQAVTEPISSAKNLGYSLAKSKLDTDLQSHALDTLLAQMDPNTGYPWLMREVIRWPRAIDFNRWRFNPLNYDLKAYSYETIRIHQQVIQQNQRYEAALDLLGQYEIGAFIVPSLAENDLHVKLYYQKSLSQFDIFYADPNLRATFINQLPPICLYSNPNPNTDHSKLALWDEQNKENQKFSCNIN